jgi:SHS family lactate transporter-like MFS transporter
LSPDSVRGFLPGFGYQCGVLLASSVSYLEAVFAHQTSYAIAMAGTAATVFVLAAAVTQLGPERQAVAFGEAGP